MAFSQLLPRLNPVKGPVGSSCLEIFWTFKTNLSQRPPPQLAVGACAGPSTLSKRTLPKNSLWSRTRYKRLFCLSLSSDKFLWRGDREQLNKIIISKSICLVILEKYLRQKSWGRFFCSMKAVFSQKSSLLSYSHTLNLSVFCGLIQQDNCDFWGFPQTWRSIWEVSLTYLNKDK